MKEVKHKLLWLAALSFVEKSGVLVFFTFFLNMFTIYKLNVSFTKHTKC